MTSPAEKPGQRTRKFPRLALAVLTCLLLAMLSGLLFYRACRSRQPSDGEPTSRMSHDAWVAAMATIRERFFSSGLDDGDAASGDWRTLALNLDRRKLEDLKSWIDFQVEILEKIPDSSALHEVRGPAIQELGYYPAAAMRYHDWLLQKVTVGAFRDEGRVGQGNMEANARRILADMDAIIRFWGRRPSAQELWDNGLFPRNRAVLEPAGSPVKPGPDAPKQGEGSAPPQPGG